MSMQPSLSVQVNFAADETGAADELLDAGALVGAGATVGDAHAARITNKINPIPATRNNLDILFFSFFLLLSRRAKTKL